MSKVWFTGDYHLGDPRLEMLQRPFTSVDEHAETLLRLHNEVVSPEDTVVNVGDIVAKNASSPQNWLECIEEFNGRKIIIRGNHDAQFEDSQLEEHFDEVVDEGKRLLGLYNLDEGKMIDTDGGLLPPSGTLPICITHYPTRSLPEFYNIVGHIHSSWKVQKNMLNVGVDVCHFRPMPEDRIGFYHAAVTDFYDDDVWCACHFANDPYNDSRGKDGTYYTPDMERDETSHESWIKLRH
jgi:calcineurin-like phosphoesterase family protein